jgi:hypothetical protein
MAAVAPLEEPVAAPVAPHVHAAPDVDVELAQLGVERTLARDAMVGALIGAVIGAGVWALIVLIALAGSDVRLGPWLLMGAGCGVFAGLFLGGWAGTMVGVGRLEAHEHATLPSAPPPEG